MSANNPLLDGIGFIQLIHKHEDPGLSVVNAARVSYKGHSDSFTERDKKLVKFLMAEGHHSPFRHCHYTFHWKAPLFLFRQAMKYQVASTWRTYTGNDVPVSLEAFDEMYSTDSGTSWNEASSRYSEMSEEWYVPKAMRRNSPHGNKQASEAVGFTSEENADAIKSMEESCRLSYQQYQALLEKGVAREIARMILPQNMYSQSYWTVSLQAVLHFLHERLDSHAQWEIQQYALGIKELIQPDLDQLGVKFND